MRLLGIDIGSTAIKGIICDDERVIHSERVPMPPRLETGDPLKYEHDPEQVRNVCFALIRDLAADVDAIAFTGQMHGGLLVDRKLNPLTNIATWQDRRSNAKLEVLREALGEDPTGVGIHHGFLIATATEWIAADAKSYSGAIPIGIYDWIASLLTGRPITDIASAAAWGMFDPIAKQWRKEVLYGAGIRESNLPEIFEPGDCISGSLSDVAKELGLSPAVKLYAGTGDTQATYLGSDCKSGDLLLNFGTGSQSMWETNEPVSSVGVDIRYLYGDRWLATSPTEAGGEAYRVFAEFVRSVISDVASNVSQNPMSMEDIFDRLNQLAETHSPDGIQFDPAFAGSKVREAASGSIAGLTRQNFRIGELAAALCAGMIREIADPYRWREEGRQPDRLIGGGSAMRQNAALRKAAERMFGMPIRLPETEFEAAFGVTRLCRLRENQT